MTSKNAFALKASDGSARRGAITTRHGIIETPAFMPVGTLGSVKAIDNTDLLSTGAQVMLSNTYHLMLRPGLEELEKTGGLHKYTSNDLPILTDSGGYQVMSLSSFRKVTDEGVEFRSHLDGSKLFLSPEEAVRAQTIIGSDIQMALDVCPRAGADENEVDESARLSLAWAKRTVAVDVPEGTLQFGIGQGGMSAEKRERSTKDICELDFDGFAIGGLSVGEPEDVMYKMIDSAIPFMPKDKPRYLMGVGKPSQMIEAIKRGVDMFDCVLPTRIARHGTLWTTQGLVRIGKAEHASSDLKIDENCTCLTCATYSRGYLRHLSRCSDPLFYRLASLHNLTYLLSMMKQIRDSLDSTGKLPDITPAD